MKLQANNPIHIVLFEPQIPQNTGNIIRTANATSSRITLIQPLGFSLSDRMLKRAGMDYFEGVCVKVASSLEEVLDNEHAEQNDVFFLSTKGKTVYTEVNLSKRPTLVFGAETHGLPSWVFTTYPNNIITIPMNSSARSLNLATSVGIVTYEAMRQASEKILNSLNN